MKGFVAPNLPGYTRNNSVKIRSKSQSLSFVNGYAIEKPAMKNQSMRSSRHFEAMVEKKKQAAMHKSAPFRPGMSELPMWLKNDKKVLQFSAYFKEAVHESDSENFRVRVCTIFYYMEDGSIHISEPKVENSGVPQGKFIKRHRIPKPGSDTCYGIDDLGIGKNITIYARTFHIFDMNNSTRAHLEKMGRREPPAEKPQLDSYTSKRQDHMMRETGADATIYRGVMMNPMKKFVEAQLGKATNKNLDGFLAFDRKVLRFDCLWDDRARVHGALHKYTMHYYLTDDTVEFIEVHEANSGFDPFPKLLKRKRLPKETEAYRSKFGENEASDASSYYNWADMRIGKHCLVFGRKIRLMDCDEFTRKFYLSKGIQMGDNLKFPVVAKREKPKLNPPAHNGIGSEEDSLGSCMSLTPKPPRKDIHKILSNNGKTLRFQAKLNNTRVDDQNRSFVITFYLADDTVAVYEPPSRNSGIIGGKFLKRQRMKNSRQEYLKAQDFFVGAFVSLGGYKFIIEDTDNYTLNYMEAHRDAFPMANINAILQKLFKQLHKQAMSMEDAFRKIDVDGSGSISLDEFKNLLSSSFSSTEITRQEVLTIMRYFDADGSGSISYDEFFLKIEESGNSGAKYRMKEAYNVEKYEQKVSDSSEADLEKQQQMKAMQYFKKVVKGKKNRMIQAYRMADDQLASLVARAAVEEIMSNVIGMKVVDARRVCEEYFGGASAVKYSDYIRLLEFVKA